MFQIDVSTFNRTNERVQKQLSRLPHAVIPACEMAVANYILNQIITKNVPPEKRVTRKSVYGKSFQSLRQQRWFFWAWRHGMIDVPYQRRGKHGGISTQWHIITEKEKGIILRNDDPAAKYVYGDDTQNKLLGVIGWPKIGPLLEEKARNVGGVLKRAADKAIKDSLKKK